MSCRKPIRILTLASPLKHKWIHYFFPSHAARFRFAGEVLSYSLQEQNSSSTTVYARYRKLNYRFASHLVIGHSDEMKTINQWARCSGDGGTQLNFSLPHTYMRSGKGTYPTGSSQLDFYGRKPRHVRHRTVHHQRASSSEPAFRNLTCYLFHVFKALLCW